VRTDVTQPGRAEDRIGHGMKQGVGIRMTIETPVVGDRFPPENQGTPSNQAVYVIPEANAHKRFYKMCRGMPGCSVLSVGRCPRCAHAAG